MMFVIVCSPSPQSFNDWVLSDRNQRRIQPVDATH
jgi:hypothetical protein